jgi:hypothetical protein
MPGPDAFTHQPDGTPAHAQPQDERMPTRLENASLSNAIHVENLNIPKMTNARVDENRPGAQRAKGMMDDWQFR